MSWLFHDTFFALVVRAVLGPTYFPHLDEMNPSSVYQTATRGMKSSETILGRGTADHDDPQDARERGLGAFGEHEVHAIQPVALQSVLTLGPGVEEYDDPLAARFGEFGKHPNLQSSLTLGTVAEDHDRPPNVRGAHATHAAALQSTLTIVGKEQPKSSKGGTDSLLVTWSGPDDPEVCQDHFRLFRTASLILFFQLAESNELVAREKNLGHVSSLPPDVFRLHWLCDIYRGDQGGHTRIPCQLGSCNSRAHIIRGRLWTRCVVH